MKMPDTKIAVTLYNIHEYCQTESDLDRSLDKLCAIGYQAVQISGVPLDYAIIRNQLDKHNLYCCATHESLTALSGDIAPIIERHQTLNCDFTAMAHPTAVVLNRPDEVERLAGILNRAGEKLCQAGITLAYHNHCTEFVRVDGSRKTMFETLWEKVLPEIGSELDLHWVTRGGGSPTAWIHRLSGRIRVIHFKDFAWFDDGPHFCEIGEGNLDWPGILNACETTGVRWYSIEQDVPIPGRDIFESMKISFDNLKAMGVY